MPSGGNPLKDNNTYLKHQYLILQKEKYTNIYPAGVGIKEVYKDTFCQYATPEKALLDLIYLREKQGEFRTSSEYYEYVLDSYRLDKVTIYEKISMAKLKKLAKLYTRKHINWFVLELEKGK